MKNYRKLFAYIVIFLIAVIALLAASNKNGIDADHVLTSLGTAFLATFLMFLFTDVFFDVDAQVGDRIEHIIRLVNHEEDVFQNEGATFSIVRERLMSFQQLDVIGYALDRFMTIHAEEIISAIKRYNARVRIVTIDPECSVIGFIDPRQQDQVRVGVTRTENAINTIRAEVGEEYAHQIEYIQVERLPHVCAIIIDPERDDAFLRLVFYKLADPTLHGTDRMCLMMNKTNSPRWLGYYAGEFEALWRLHSPLAKRC